MRGRGGKRVRVGERREIAGGLRDDSVLSIMLSKLGGSRNRLRIMLDCWAPYVGLLGCRGTICIVDGARHDNVTEGTDAVGQCRGHLGMMRLAPLTRHDVGIFGMP